MVLLTVKPKMFLFFLLLLKMLLWETQKKIYIRVSRKTWKSFPRIMRSTAACEYANWTIFKQANRLVGLIRFQFSAQGGHLTSIYHCVINSCHLLKPKNCNRSGDIKCRHLQVLLSSMKFRIEVKSLAHSLGCKLLIGLLMYALNDFKVYKEKTFFYCRPGPGSNFRPLVSSAGILVN